ncbi:ALC-interacting protein [Melia azedarach]|uniref:ALC-interacting protein n=1 Tax=Melia azedarach TaxID=155640 RepID=A0ACC1WZ29_MELAZ|nr:ALC-interacting protein [Melia azedarach]
MSNPKKADSGCFAGVLRRLLCQGSLQTHPSDQMTEISKPEVNEQKEEPKTEAKTQPPGPPRIAPGVVARLMGLESLPEANWVPKGKTPDQVTRSRSVNFMDYLLEFNAAQAQQHRRVRTSVSFREVPTPLHQQDHDLYVLYLDELEEKRKMGLKVRKSAVDFRELKQKKEEKSKNKKENMRERLAMKKKDNEGNKKKVSKFIDEPRRASVKQSSMNNRKGAKDLGVLMPGKKSSNQENGVILKKKCPVKLMHQKEVAAKGKVSKKSQNQQVIEEVKQAEAECSLENSSPVSVLDVNDFSIYENSPLSEWRTMDLNSRWKSSLKIVNFDYPSPHFKQISSNNDQCIDYYVELVGKLSKFTEEAIVQSSWVPEKELNFEDLEEMCTEFGQHILEVLLQQVIDELVGFNMERCVV